mmetsp:Transcript_98485/g.180203  ORF Transcript_98485/g.180203 Transcript_98485/m.180203 type:complete len:133 (+) Transcript_98485:116-514(+)
MCSWLASASTRQGLPQRSSSRQSFKGPEVGRGAFNAAPGGASSVLTLGDAYAELEASSAAAGWLPLAAERVISSRSSCVLLSAEGALRAKCRRTQQRPFSCSSKLAAAPASASADEQSPSERHLRRWAPTSW